jgi:hypothetical protein
VLRRLRLLEIKRRKFAALQKFGLADAFFEHFSSRSQQFYPYQERILSLLHAGRVSYMGELLGDVTLPLRTFLRKDLKLHGKWMYSRDDIGLLVKMIEIGILTFKRRTEFLSLGSIHST